MGWRVRVFSAEGPDASQLCRDAGARLVFIEWPSERAEGAVAEPAEENERRELARGRASMSMAQYCMVSPSPVIATAFDPCAEDIVAAMKAGAADFLVLDAASEAADESLGVALERLTHMHVRDCGVTGVGPIESRLAGRSKATVLMRSRLEGLATLSGPVLVFGETGSGRDTVARALHAAGPEPTASFRKIDCDGWRPGGSLPSAGTIYLDHVDRLTSGGQQYWVHCLAEMRRANDRGLRFVASAGPAFAASTPDDDRAVGDLHATPDAPRFDAALRAELMRFPIEIVPLRDRLEDVPVIADQIVRRIGVDMKREVRLTEDAYAFLAEQGWPGNVAQLARLLERAVAFCAGGLIDCVAMEQLMDDFEESLAAIRRKREIIERDELLETLARTGGNISRSAEQMGRSRGAIYRLIQKYGIALPRTMKKVRPVSGAASAKATA